MAGEQTGEFGEWLDYQIRASQAPLKVYYDHGNSELGNVGKINAIVGSELTTASKFAEVDILVVDAQNNTKLVIEIEDKSSMSPKKIFGVVFSILLSDQFVFTPSGTEERIYFEITPETHFIVAGFANPQGQKHTQLAQFIQPKLYDLDIANVKFDWEKVEFVLGNDPNNTINMLKSKIATILGLSY